MSEKKQCAVWRRLGITMTAIVHRIEMQPFEGFDGEIVPWRDGRALAFAVLDLAPYGRQQDFEDSPAGWPQHPTYG